MELQVSRFLDYLITLWQHRRGLLITDCLTVFSLQLDGGCVKNMYLLLLLLECST